MHVVYPLLCCTYRVKVTTLVANPKEFRTWHFFGVLVAHVDDF